MREFADIARQEYLAVGLRVGLHPQIDLATEPRWGRISGTFGEDADLTSRLAAAYIRGFQGGALGPRSVAMMTKHFPGGGPQKDGDDPHFPWGREQVYPGSNFEYHLAPFRAAIEAGTSQMMPYYGMPVGTEYEEVGFGYNRSVITGILRDELHFDGIVCTDWGLVSGVTDLGDVGFDLGEIGAAKAWGVEHLDREERVRKIIEAGVDQLGGEHCPELVVRLVKSGKVAEARIDESARRLLREKFVLGLFDDPYVDESEATIVVGRRNSGMPPGAPSSVGDRARERRHGRRNAAPPAPPGPQGVRRGRSPEGGRQPCNVGRPPRRCRRRRGAPQGGAEGRSRPSSRGDRSNSRRRRWARSSALCARVRR